MSRDRAERRAKELGEPHFAAHYGKNRWKVVVPGVGGACQQVIEE